jgi:hypothetical protein
MWLWGSRLRGSNSQQKGLRSEEYERELHPRRRFESQLGCISCTVTYISACIESEGKVCVGEKNVFGDYWLAGCELTDATASLKVTQIFQLNFGADFRPRALEPVQEDMAGPVEGVHGSESGV